MRRLILALGLLCALAFTACGDDGGGGDADPNAHLTAGALDQLSCELACACGEGCGFAIVGEESDEAVELIRYADMNECLTSDLNGDPDFVYPNAADCRDALLSGSCVETDSGAPALSLPDECLGVDVPCSSDADCPKGDACNGEICVLPEDL